MYYVRQYYKCIRIEEETSWIPVLTTILQDRNFSIMQNSHSQKDDIAGLDSQLNVDHCSVLINTYDPRPRVHNTLSTHK